MTKILKRNEIKMSIETAQAKSRELKTNIVFNGYYRVHPEDRQKFIDAVADHIPPTAQSSGCTYYVFAADILDPNVFHLSEGWESDEALAKHHSSEIFQRALGGARETVRILDHQGQRYDIAKQSDGSPPGGVEVQH